MSTPFAELSCALTGEAMLNSQLAAEFEQRLRYHFDKELTDLLATFKAQPSGGTPDDRARAALGQDGKLHKLAREILRLWYTGQFQTPFDVTDPPLRPEHYSEGLLWKVIKTHAPGFSPPDAKYGVWAKPPA